MSILNTISSARGLKNLIINGDMAIDQRWGGAAISAAASTNAYLVDRWFMVQVGGGGAKINTGRNQLGFSTPDQHIYYLNANVVSAYAVTSLDVFSVMQHIEGFNAASLMYGTSSAKTATLSFWVRSSLIGTFGGALRNSSDNRSYPFTYTISAANTWEKKSITIPGDTTGTWNRTNLKGITVMFALGTGTTYKGPAGSWAGANYVDAVGTTNLVATNGANWNITGVQFEEGSAATEFERRDFGTELQLCQRYYEKSYDLTVAPGTISVAGPYSHKAPSANAFFTIPFRCSKRVGPTSVVYSPATGASGQIRDATGAVDRAASIYIAGQNAISIQCVTQPSGNEMNVHWAADAEL